MTYVAVNKRSFPGKTRISKNKNYIPNGSRIDRDGEHLISLLKIATIFSAGSIYYESAATFRICG